ncbi:MAG: ATP-binding cassette domain-containing protein, partial [Gammaproteobacteria bacterium]|nr:ATP-binding cassette domain-containing protein [Gammaproteobacteria bacterium]
MYGLYFGVERKILEQRIDELLHYMQLADRAIEKPDNLSGGMKRRLTIARALINDPDLVILDEPTTGLDPQVRHLIWSRLRELLEAGKTLLLTTHYMDEAERLCDELLIIDHGKILDQGSPVDIIQRNVEKEVLEIRGKLTEARNILPENMLIEQYGDTLFCYADDVDVLLPLFANDDRFVWQKRRCNLEDVFLRMTGRDLRE